MAVEIAVTAIFTTMTALAIWKNWEVTALVFGVSALVVGCQVAGVQ